MGVKEGVVSSNPIEDSEYFALAYTSYLFFREG